MSIVFNSVKKAYIYGGSAFIVVGSVTRQLAVADLAKFEKEARAAGKWTETAKAVTALSDSGRLSPDGRKVKAIEAFMKAHDGQTPSEFKAKQSEALIAAEIASELNKVGQL